MIEGACHCGIVRWQFDGDPQSATACNCTVCRRYGVLWAYDFEGERIDVSGPTRAYTRGEREIGFHFCAHCGCVAYWRGIEPGADGRRRIAVNLRMAEPGAVGALPVEHFDGLELDKPGARRPLRRGYVVLDFRSCKGTIMRTDVAEIAEGIWRFSTHVPQIAPPLGFTFNQFLIDADEPFLFHTGPRAMFPLVSAALQSVMPIDRLRWISFGHIESDECGAMNQWLAAAPDAQVVHGQTACMVSLNDLADRPPRALANGEDIGPGRTAHPLSRHAARAPWLGSGCGL